MPSPRRLVAATLAALAIAGSSTLACASDGAPPGAPSRRALRDACRDDYRRFCASVPRGDGRIAACFEAHAAELSPGCRDVLRAARAAQAGGVRDGVGGQEQKGGADRS